MAEKSFKERVSEFITELKAPKNHTCSFGRTNYNYRSKEDILEAAKKLLPKYNLLLTIDEQLDHLYFEGEPQRSDCFIKAKALLRDIK